MRRSNAADDTASTLSNSEAAFVLRGAKRRSGPEMMRHIATANAGSNSPKRKSGTAGKAKKTAKRRKA